MDEESGRRDLGKVGKRDFRFADFNFGTSSHKVNIYSGSGNRRRRAGR